MNERLTTRNLAELLANQTGLDRKGAEEFIKALSTYFVQSLEKNKVVKIFGLGVFKIMLVRERESVHIQTGQRFIIPMHHKISFVPDKDFKEQINRPFALFEPIEANGNEIYDINQLKNQEMSVPESFADSFDAKESFWEDDYSKSTPFTDNDAFEEEAVESLSMADNNVFEEKAVESLSMADNNVFEEKAVESLTLESGNYNIEDYFDSATINEVNIIDDVETIYDDYKFERTEESKIIPDELPYEVISASTIYSNEIPDITQTSITEKDDNESTFDDNESVFITNKKKKTAPLWLFFLILPLVFVGSIIGGYIFVKINSNKSLYDNKKQNTSIMATTNEANSPLPIGVVIDAEINSSDNSDSLEKSGSLASNNIKIETATTENENQKLVFQNDDTISENTNTSRKQDIRTVTDWIAPSPANRINNEIKRVNAPNRVIEGRNSALTGNSKQSSLENTSRSTTVDNKNTLSATTITTANAKKLPARIQVPVGSTLRQIAFDYYGDKTFWVYIYEHNKNTIKNPDIVPAGTVLLLPAPNTYGIDANNKSSVQKAQQIQSQLMKKNN